jgi:hypothetical protein
MANPARYLTSGTNARYSYTPLKGPKSFRLLYFTPTSEISDYIDCTIEEFERRSVQCPAYTALSYAWGDVKTIVSITLNGRLSFVTENLHEALLHLRRVHPRILIWVDALSINQTDDSERSHQVSQMRAIYSEASKVISWVGPGFEITDRLFLFIRGHHDSCTVKDGLAEDCTFLADRELADAIGYLENRPYWNRIWVIQEVVVATNLELMCGFHSIDWHVFATFWPLIFENHFKKVQGMNRRLAPLRRSSAILSLSSWRRSNVSLAYALELTGLSRATDGRDKVYALLGLVDKGAGQHIVVDYTLPPCTVFLVATKALIEDWDDNTDAASNAARKKKLQDMLSRIEELPVYRRQVRHGSPLLECTGVAHLKQHVRFMLGCSNYLDVDLPPCYVDSNLSCDGEYCGSWATMWKAATIHKNFRADFASA